MIISFTDLLTGAATLVTTTAIANRAIDKIAGGFVTRKEFLCLQEQVHNIDDTCLSILEEVTKVNS